MDPLSEGRSIRDNGSEVGDYWVMNVPICFLIAGTFQEEPGDTKSEGARTFDLLMTTFLVSNFWPRDHLILKFMGEFSPSFSI